MRIGRHAASSMMLIAFIATSAPARAAEVDLSTLVMDASGKPFQRCTAYVPASAPPQCAASVDQTLGALLTTAFDRPPDPGLTIMQQAQRGALALRLAAGGTIDLSVDDVKVIEAQLEKLGMNPVAMVRVLTVIDPAALKK